MNILRNITCNFFSREVISEFKAKLDTSLAFINNPMNGVHLILTALFIVFLLITNIITAKYFTIKNISLTAGVVTYPMTFIITDIISEVFGKRSATQTIWLGFIASIIMLVAIELVKLIPYEYMDSPKQKVFMNIFDYTPGVIVGSMLAYLTSQFLDIYLFDFIKKLTRGKYLWIRNNIATIISQLIDTFIFAITAWVIWPLLSSSQDISIVTWETWIKISLFEYCFKIVFAILDTPIVYMGINMIRKNCKID